MVTLDDPSDVLAFLAEPINAVRGALEHGMSWADIALDGRPYDPHIWAHLVRYEARNDLGGGSAVWRLQDLANSGNCIVRTPLVMRAMKMQDGRPPSPGHSFSRRAFWRQTPGQQNLGLSWGDVQEPVDGSNLILGWTPGLRGAVALSLAKPVATWRYKEQPKLAWSLPVEFDQDDVPRFVVADEEVDVEPKFDLDELGPDGAEP